MSHALSISFDVNEDQPFFPAGKLEEAHNIARSSYTRIPTHVEVERGNGFIAFHFYVEVIQPERNHS